MSESKESKSTRKKRVAIPQTKEQRLRSERLVATTLRSNPDVFNLPISKRTTEDLANYFSKLKEGTKLILPKEKIRYAVYLRRSTDAEDRQMRSLDDQLDEITKMSKRMGIAVREEDVFWERESAKKSGKRPIFDSMLMKFRTGTFQGLLAYSPDRLSRNMKEAGEIIEMIDEEIIQELQFPTYTFENSPNGKMMLGILFATSKQYSDKLSVDIKRGTDGNANEGKYNGSIKKGYYADMPSKHFVPDGINWQLLRQGVVMRLYEGKTNTEVAEFLANAHWSYKATQFDKYKLAKVNKKNMGDIFSDPFYCGVYRYGDNVANLSELYNFMPLMSPDEYIAINRGMSEVFNETFVGRSSATTRIGFGLLRDKVTCDFCDGSMIFQRTKIQRGKNKGSWFISFYCRNEDCIRHDDEKAIKKYGHKLQKSVRARVVESYIEWAIRNMTKNTEGAYKLYIERLEQKLRVDREITKNKIKDAQEEIKEYRTRYQKYQNLQLEDTEGYKKHHSGKLEDYRSLWDASIATEKRLKEELEILSTKLPNQDEFVELIHSYLEILLKSSDLMEQDAVYQELVLNLRVGDNAVSVIKLNPPYDLMVDLEKVRSGGA